MREELGQEILGMTSNKPMVFRLIKKNQKPALKGRYYPSIKTLPSEEIIFDPKTKTRRKIRYAPGETSVFKDEQPEKVVLGSVVFQNGSLIVPQNNPLLLEYLEVSNYNHGNPVRIRETRAVFTLLDPESEAKDSMDVEISQIRGANAAIAMPFDAMKAYARVLGVNINNSSSMIRHDMIVLAKADPDKFMSGIDDPLVKRQQVILDAMQYRVIEVSGRSISWVLGDKKSLIIPVPLGQKAVSWFAEWTMNENDGEKVYSELEKKLEKYAE